MWCDAIGGVWIHPCPGWHDGKQQWCCLPFVRRFESQRHLIGYYGFVCCLLSDPRQLPKTQPASERIDQLIDRSTDR